MIVEQIWTANAYRNFNYLIACPATGEALAIDPLDHAKCLAAAKAKGWSITQILNTHEHGDHTGGNPQVVAATGAKVLAHVNARDKIPGMDRGLKAGDVIRVGKSVELECLDTPGHTMSHICLRSHGDAPARQAPSGKPDPDLPPLLAAIERAAADAASEMQSVIAEVAQELAELRDLLRRRGR